MSQIEKEGIEKLVRVKIGGKSEAAGQIIHDINNPLTIVLGRIGQLKMELKKTLPDGPAHNHLNSVEEQIFRIIGDLKRIRSIHSPLEEGGSEHLNLQKFFMEIMDCYREKFEKYMVRIDVSEAEEMLMLKANSSEIKHAFLAIIENSYEFLKKTTDPWIRFRFSAQSDAVELQITDSGSGLPEEVCQKLFQPFPIAEKEKKSKGLGLVAAKILIESNGGELSYDASCENTQFTIRFPKAE